MARRPNGMGTVSLRSDGRWCGRYWSNGKRVPIYGKTEEEVWQKLNRVLVEQEDGNHIDRDAVTVKDWCEFWLEMYVATATRQSTYINYCGHVKNHIIPNVGHIALQELMPKDVQGMIKNMQKNGINKHKQKTGCSEKTIKNVMVTLNNALDQAVEDRKMRSNPCKSIKLKKGEKKEMRVLSMEEQANICEVVRRSDRLATFAVIFTVSTGIRIGEASGLRWGDFDADDQSIKIRRTLSRLQKENPVDGEPKTEIVVGPPKTKSSIRRIPLYDKLWDETMEYREKQRQFLSDIGKKQTESTYVFCGNAGDCVEPRMLQEYFEQILVASGIKAGDAGKPTFHTLRHTFATRAIENDMDVKTLSALLGHTSVQFTMDRYAHVLEKHKKESMEKMSRSHFSGNKAYDDNLAVQSKKSEEQMLVSDGGVSGKIISIFGHQNNSAN